MARYRDIATAFTKNGFGYFVRELGLDRVFSLPRRLLVNRDQNLEDKTVGERIRQFLEDLGPTFIKVGQLASTRPDLIPKDIRMELSKLQDHISPVPFEQVRKIIEDELEGEMEELFYSFEESPLGVASIGQVHEAVLPTGEKVAVKVQRPNVGKQVHIDLEILHEMAERAEKRLDWAKRYQVVDVVEEFKKSITSELDYEHEGRNADLMAKQFEDDPQVYIPEIYWDYTTKKVLTMEYVEGIKLNDQEGLAQAQCDNKWLAEKLVQAIFYQMFEDGYFHADPHIGNFFALPEENGIAFMDFGLVGRLSKDMQRNLASIVIAMTSQDTKKMTRAMKRMGVVPADIDEHEWEGDVDQFLIKYYDVPFSEISLGQSITDMFQIAHKHQIEVPSDFTLIGKTMLTLEGVVAQLDPDFSIITAAEPFGRKLIRDKYHPKRFAKEIYDQVDEYADVIEEMPEIVRELTALAKERKIPVELRIPALNYILSKMDRVSNLLSFSIILLAFSLIMTGIIIGSAIAGQGSVLWDIPALEIGFVIAVGMLAWMIYSIFRSGRF
ncbi:ABC1 kinase family protein [Allobacillus halotolerans]|uniref:AarF/ABC1/UbiB kinase family protein n=1 Tax=Allobacillus halotolerans TaxID=570278 RepID=A0ABS6GLF6_9BACI|nr:AarF/ABC1/UbiB kinase family protein [Allobacillus halotolerans]MBU6079911.1 AarF/ABC1/UbiB kinase family protein [Allobacillus halotolerans]